jgi:enamine deaminase RidA (YjgF/YER057c/UK114 family)
MKELKFEVINSPDLADPIGYNNGMLATEGRVLFIAGQIGWDKEKRVVSDRFSAQFEQALTNVISVVRAAGGGPANIGKFTIFVTDKEEYLNQIKEVGAAYRKLMGRHFPAMALVEVKALLEPAAKVEIEGIAII